MRTLKIKWCRFRIADEAQTWRRKRRTRFYRYGSGDAHATSSTAPLWSRWIGSKRRATDREGMLVIDAKVFEEDTYWRKFRPKREFDLEAWKTYQESRHTFFSLSRPWRLSVELDPRVSICQLIPWIVRDVIVVQWDYNWLTGLSNTEDEIWRMPHPTSWCCWVLRLFADPLGSDGLAFLSDLVTVLSIEA